MAVSLISTGVQFPDSTIQTTAAGGGSGLTYISQVVASSSSTVSFTGLTAYDNYMVIWSKVKPGSQGTNFNMLTSTDNGSNYATTSYQYSVLYSTSNNGTVNGRFGGANASIIRISGNSLDSNVSASFTSGQIILNINNGSSKNFTMYGMANTVDESSITQNGSLAATRSETSATNAVRFYFDTGNIASGTFRLYGIVNS